MSAPRTMRQALVKGLLFPIFIMGGLCAGFYATLVVVNDGSLTPSLIMKEHDTPESPAHLPSPSQVRLAAMLAEGKCWNDTGTHPIPNHSWFKLPGGKLQYGSAHAGLAIAFDGAPGTVYAFCLGGK